MTTHYILADRYEAACKVAKLELTGAVRPIYGTEAELVVAWRAQNLAMQYLYRPWVIVYRNSKFVGWEANLEVSRLATR